MKKWKVYFLSILITLLVGLISGLLTMNSMGIYSTINRPPLSPPSWLFPIVWTILYTFMGICLARYIIKANTVPRIYVLQLLVNFIWPFIFFNLEAYLFAFIWLLLLITLVILMILEFYRVDKLAGLLQIPYLIWLLFALYLNFTIYLFN